MRNGYMTGSRTATRRVVMQKWLVYRINPITDSVDTFELTCEEGTFLTHYRMLGLADELMLVDKANRVRFDPMVDDWDKKLLDSWIESAAVRRR